MANYLNSNPILPNLNDKSKGGLDNSILPQSIDQFNELTFHYLNNVPENDKLQELPTQIPRDMDKVNENNIPNNETPKVQKEINDRPPRGHKLSAVAMTAASLVATTLGEKAHASIPNRAARSNYSHKPINRNVANYSNRLSLKLPDIYPYSPAEKHTRIMPKIDSSKLPTLTVANSEGAEELPLQAVVSLENKEINLIFAEVDEPTKRMILNALTTSKPFIEASFNNDDLAEVLFTRGNFKPYFNSKDKRVYMPIPDTPDQTVSPKLLVEALLHEVIHSLTANMYKDVGFDKVDYVNFSKACKSMNLVALQDYRNSYESTLSYLKDINLNDNPEWDAINKATIEQVNILEETLVNNANPNRQNIPPVCRDTSFSGIVYYVSSKLNIDHTTAQSYINKLFSKDKAIGLISEWTKSSDEFSIFNKLDESNYLSSRDWPEWFKAGHSKQNISEVMSTVLAVAITMPGKFWKTIDSLSIDERKAVMNTMEATITYISGRYPQLKTTLWNIMANR